jgi:hypothetical protein
MEHELSDNDLDEIERRVARALDVAPVPWRSWLETRDGIGGSSFVQITGGADADIEMCLEVHLGAERLASPDARLDATVDFVGNVASDVPRLVAEVKRLRRRVD